MLRRPRRPRRPGAVSDVDILNFGLRLERLQATFYTQAEELGHDRTDAADQAGWAETLGAHERAHVKIIKQVLGPKAEPSPAFDFGDANESEPRSRAPRWRWRTSRSRCSAA